MMADLATQDASLGLDRVTFTPDERVADRLFEGEDAVLHVMGWVGRCPRRGRFVDGSRLFGLSRGPTLGSRIRIELIRGPCTDG